MFAEHNTCLPKAIKNSERMSYNKSLPSFLCDKNPDVERFLKEQSIEFTKEVKAGTENEYILVQLLKILWYDECTIGL